MKMALESVEAVERERERERGTILEVVFLATV